MGRGKRLRDTLNAGQLIDILLRHAPDTEVIIAKDEEGNGFKSLEEVEYSAIERYHDYEIDVLHPDDEEDDAEYERAIVLWP